MRIQRTLPDAEDIGPLATDDLTDELAAVACAADDVLDRHSPFGMGHDRGVGFLATQIALILQLFSAGEQVGLDRRRADRGPDHAHGPAHSVEERRACVLHQMPAIGDLDGTRQSSCSSFCVTSAAITSQDPNLGMISKPGGNCRDLAVWKQRYDPPPLKIADDRSIAVIAAKGPIIDAGHIDNFSGQAGSAPDDPEQCVVADRHDQPLGETGGGSAAKRQSKMVDDALQTRRPAATVPSSKRSAKIRLRQDGFSQTKRRATSRSPTLLPAHGKSETVLT